jgi:hypothetical protein
MMAPSLTGAVSKITSGFYILALAAIVVGVISVAVGRRFGGKTRRQRRATADLAWAVGLLLIGIFILPHLFK